MPTRSMLAFFAVCVGLMITPASAAGPIAPLASSFHPPDSSLHFVAAKAKVRTESRRSAESRRSTESRRPADSKRPTGVKRRSSTPYCPYGKKADGTCWVRCSQVICL